MRGGDCCTFAARPRRGAEKEYWYGVLDSPMHPRARSREFNRKGSECRKSGRRSSAESRRFGRLP